MDKKQINEVREKTEQAQEATMAVVDFLEGRLGDDQETRWMTIAMLMVYLETWCEVCSDQGWMDATLEYMRGLVLPKE